VSRAGSLLSWSALAAAVLGVMAARWTWLLLTPDGAAMPPAAWEEASDNAGRVFGTAPAPAAAAGAAPINIKLVGVFANRTKGFAILQVDDKQIGVAQGDEVRPGLRLAETHADYVVLNQGGATQRVQLTGAAAPSGAVPVLGGMAAVGVTAAPTNTPPASDTPPAAPTLGKSPTGPNAAQIDQVQHLLNATPNLPPARRNMLEHKIQAMRGQH
jgi:Type II secretion system protein C